MVDVRNNILPADEVYCDIGGGGSYHNIYIVDWTLEIISITGSNHLCYYFTLMSTLRGVWHQFAVLFTDHFG